MSIETDAELNAAAEAKTARGNATTSGGAAAVGGTKRWWHQPRTVWAVAFAATVSFMGIGLVDPILPAITEELNATPTEASLLFTSYLFVTAAAMFFTSWVSSRLGARNTLLLGLAIVVVFAAASGLAGSVPWIIGFRAVWGLGNALFISTALATIIGESHGDADGAIILYEAALGVGMAVGPLVGGVLGSISWRAPFLGTAALMAIAFVAIAFMLRGGSGARPRNTPKVPVFAAFAALKRPALLSFGLIALFYNMGFFVILAWTPYPLGFGAMGIGLTFFGWGLALALTSVFGAPALTRRFKRTHVVGAGLLALLACLVVCALVVGSVPALVAMMVVSGLILGVMNTVLTESSMESTDLPRPVASSAYSGIRFLGGAVAPPLASALAASSGFAGAPYLFGAGALVVALVLFFALHSALAAANHHGGTDELEGAEALIGDAS